MKKLHKQARELLHAASKVYHYRRDIMSTEELTELETLAANLKTVTNEKGASEENYRGAMDALHSHLVKIGGKIYPKTFLSDNIEVCFSGGNCGHRNSVLLFSTFHHSNQFHVSNLQRNERARLRSG